MSWQEGDAPDFGPGNLIAILYVLSIAVGFGGKIPALSPNGLFALTLTLVLIGHLVHVAIVYQYYDAPSWTLLIYDGLIIVLSAHAFNMVVNPVVAAHGGFAVSSAEFLEAFGTVAQSTQKDAMALAFLHFFSAVGFIFLLFFLWHGHVESNPHEGLSIRERSNWVVKKLGWFALIVSVGWGGAGVFMQMWVDWHAGYRVLAVLSWVATVSAFGFMIALAKYGPAYEVTR